jgi:hypothetical protein
VHRTQVLEGLAQNGIDLDAIELCEPEDWEEIATIIGVGIDASTGNFLTSVAVEWRIEARAADAAAAAAADLPSPPPSPSLEPDGMQAPPSPTSQRGVQQAPPSPVMEPLDEPKSFTDKPKKSFTETLGVSASVFHAVVQAHGPSFDNMKSSLGIQAALSIEQRGLTSSGKKNSKKKNKKVSKQPDGFAFTITATDSKQLATATAGLRKVIQHAEAAEAQKQQLATKKQLAVKQQQQQRKDAELAARRTADARRSRDRKELDAVRSNSSSTKALIEEFKRKLAHRALALRGKGCIDDVKQLISLDKEVKASQAAQNLFDEETLAALSEAAQHGVFDGTAVRAFLAGRSGASLA